MQIKLSQLYLCAIHKPKNLNYDNFIYYLRFSSEFLIFFSISCLHCLFKEKQHLNAQINLKTKKLTQLHV